MAKTLVGFYNTLTEAEGVLQDLVEHGFARKHIMLATPHATLPRQDSAGIDARSTLEGGQDIKNTLVDLGVSESEASTYVEGIKGGGALVVLQISEERVQDGIDILHRQGPAGRHTGLVHGRYYIGRGRVTAGSAPNSSAESEGTEASGFARYSPDFRHHYTTMSGVGGLTYMDYQPAYRYGYDIGERYPDTDWQTLQEEIRHSWEMWHPGTWERFQAAIRHGWDTVRGRI